MDNLDAGIRCQDIHGGLRNVDAATSGLIVRHLEQTRLAGMASALAVNIRGREVIPDPAALQAIAAEQLGIEGFAFKPVLDVLQELEFARVELNDGRLYRIQETVPLHRDVFEQVGSYWADQKTTQVEEEIVAVVDSLADGPLLVEDLRGELGVDAKDVATILNIGDETEMIKSLELRDGSRMVYSPLYSFENPTAIMELFESHPSDQVRATLERVKGEQGIPLSDGDVVLADAVGRGLLPAPSVQLPNKTLRPFVCNTTGVGTDFLKVQKSTLDKALAAIACVRCGQHFGGATSLAYPVAVLRKLLDPSRGNRLKAHSSARRQYMLLHKMQVVRYIKDGDWVAPQLIDTEDNKEAIRLAIDMLTFGEPVVDRGVNDQAQQSLLTQGRYLDPLQTVRAKKKQVTLPDATWEKLTEALRGGVVL